MKSVKPKESKFQRFIHRYDRLDDTRYKLWLMHENIMHLPIPFEDYLEYLKYFKYGEDPRKQSIYKNYFIYTSHCCDAKLVATVRNNKVVDFYTYFDQCCCCFDEYNYFTF